MLGKNTKKSIAEELRTMQNTGLFKEEKVIESRSGAELVVNGRKLLNFCGNDYLGLSQEKSVVEAAQKGLRDWKLGMGSVRFIAGTATLHKELEMEIAKFFRTEDAILYSSCFDANGGIFEVLLQEGDAVFSDELNHASIIDGIRLCKAERFRFPHNNLTELEKQLASSNARRKLIITDGVFSMDGDIAHLDTLATLAKKYEALLMVDDSHGSGVLGKTGRGSSEEKGVLSDSDILTSTFGKALGGAGGGFATGKKELIDLLRQRSRPYLFSNSLMPAICSAARYVLKHFDAKFLPRKEKLAKNLAYFRKHIETLGFTLGGGAHPITPVMIFDEKKTMALADGLFREGIYVRGFAYPVVPRGNARIRIQLSALHTRDDLDKALEAIEKIGKKLQLIS